MNFTSNSVLVVTDLPNYTHKALIVTYLKHLKDGLTLTKDEFIALLDNYVDDGTDELVIASDNFRELSLVINDEPVIAKVPEYSQGYYFYRTGELSTVELLLSLFSGRDITLTNLGGNYVYMDKDRHIDYLIKADEPGIGSSDHSIIFNGVDDVCLRLILGGEKLTGMVPPSEYGNRTEEHIVNFIKKNYIKQSSSLKVKHDPFGGFFIDISDMIRTSAVETPLISETMNNQYILTDTLIAMCDELNKIRKPKTVGELK